jgi:DNA-binding GntR family transcriptional regulator
LLTISERAPSILTSESTARHVGRDRRAHRTEQVVEVLREAIGTGRLRPGERLVEKHIAVELGTSRTPVREALRELVHEGLVLHTPYRGAFVLGVQEDEVHGVLIPIRLTLEKYGFARALERIGETDLAELERVLGSMERAAAAGDLRSVVDADVRFHELVLEVSRLPHTTQIWRAIAPRIRACFFYYDRDRDLSAVVDEHRELLAAIRSGDLDGLERLLDEHIGVPRLGELTAAAAGHAGEGDRWHR